MNKIGARAVLLFLIGMVPWLSIFPQEGIISGRVVFDGEPVSFVTVGVPGLGIGVATDHFGEFTLKNVPPGEYIMNVSRIGYEKQEKQIEVRPDETLTLEIELRPTNVFLDEVVVVDEQTGLTNRTPHSISRIEAKELTVKGSPSGLVGIVSQVPGVQNADMGQGISKPFIRGLGFSRVVTVFQGNKLENHQWGADHGLGLNDLGVSRVEVVKGPASIFYGSGAIGGVLLVKDDESYLRSKELTGSAGATYNSVSAGVRPWISLGKSMDNGLFFAADAAAESHADYRDGNKRTIGNSRYNNQTLRLHAGYNSRKFKNKLSYTFLRQNLGIIEGNEMVDSLSLATTRNDRDMQLPFQKVNDHVLSYRQNTVHNKFITSLNLSYHVNDRDEIEDDFDEVDLGLRMSHLYYNARISHKTTDYLESNLGVQGSVRESSNKTVAEEILIPDASVYETGLYYVAGLSLGDYFVQAGLRYDYHTMEARASADHIVDYGYTLPGDPDNQSLSRVFSGWTGTAGFSRSILDNSMLKVNFSSGFRSPDMAELFSNGHHPGTSRFEKGNATFDREQSYQLDADWLYESNVLRWGVALFANTIDNYIYFTGTGEYTDDNLEIWKFRQDNAFLYGGELQISWTPLTAYDLEIRGTSNLVRGINRDNQENLTYIPAANYCLRVQGSPFADSGPQAFVKINYVDRQKWPGPGEDETPSYVLLNAGVTHDLPLNGNTLSLGITGFNLLNNVYTDHMSILRAFNVTQPGRNIMGSVRYSF